MGAFEEKVRNTIEELAAGDMLEESVDEILDAHAGVFGLWAYSQLLAAREVSNTKAATRDANAFQLARGRVVAYQEMWLKVVFDGRSVEEGTLTQDDIQAAEVYWTERLRVALEALAA